MKKPRQCGQRHAQWCRVEPRAFPRDERPRVGRCHRPRSRPSLGWWNRGSPEPRGRRPPTGSARRCRRGRLQPPRGRSGASLHARPEAQSRAPGHRSLGRPRPTSLPCAPRPAPIAGRRRRTGEAGTAPSRPTAALDRPQAGGSARRSGRGCLPATCSTPPDRDRRPSPRRALGPFRADGRRTQRPNQPRFRRREIRSRVGPPLTRMPHPSGKDPGTRVSGRNKISASRKRREKDAA